MTTLDTPIGELARMQPAATRVFLRHRLDFCCGGRRTLAEACANAGLDPAAIARELAAATTPDAPIRWDAGTPAELTALVDHIMTRYHETLRRDVPALIEAARRVEHVHAGKPDVPAGLAQELIAFWAAMQDHMMKEEAVLFPMLCRGARGQQVFMPVRMMEHEHTSHGEHLAAIRRLTGDLVIPPNACATWTALYRGLETMERELMEHIHLENNVLFVAAVH